jgi:hypothetical protein
MRRVITCDVRLQLTQLVPGVGVPAALAAIA